MSQFKADRLIPWMAAMLLFIALPSAVAQQRDYEDPNTYPGSWFRIALDTDGNFQTGDGHGYNDGTWYYYPQTGWYRQSSTSSTLFSTRRNSRSSFRSAAAISRCASSSWCRRR